MSSLKIKDNYFMKSREAECFVDEKFNIADIGQYHFQGKYGMMEENPTRVNMEEIIVYNNPE